MPTSAALGRHRRVWHLVILLLAGYLALDFTDPNIPGALNFNVDLNTDGVLTEIVKVEPVKAGRAEAVGLPARPTGTPGSYVELEPPPVKPILYAQAPHRAPPRPLRGPSLARSPRS
jgi:hypothetical protein